MLNSVERIGAWPTDSIHNVMVAVPKAEGEGHRLIGLLTFIYRLWARVRYPVVRAWEQRHSTDAFWAAPGRDASMAAFDHDIAGEMEHLTG